MALNDNPNTSNSEWFVICNRELVLRTDNERMQFSDIERIKSLFNSDLIDFFEETETGIGVLSLKSKQNLPQEYTGKELRLYFAENDEDTSAKAFRAKALAEWRQNTVFCAHCGTKLIGCKTFTALECPECQRQFFPRIDPCVIVLVNKGEQILLARHVQRNQDIYACIAGFVEAGESIEQAVRREILEEVGLKVKNITYQGSQSWPFPQQLMLGFTAEYESGDIALQRDEIADAQWFDRNACPACPKPGSIAHKLIYGTYR